MTLLTRLSNKIPAAVYAFVALLPLVLFASASPVRAQQNAPVAAPTVSAQDAIPAASAPYLMINKTEKLTFTDPSKITLRTWYLQSMGAGEIEARVWYIANGVASPRGQKLLYWMQRKQSGAWRLYLLEQNGASDTVLPSYSLEAQFDDAAKPDASASGVYGGASLKPIRLPSPLNSTAEIANTNAPGLPPNQTLFLYVAQTLPADPAKTPSAMGLVAKPGPTAMETLTKASKTPGTVFLVVSLTWKPAQMVAK